MALRDAYFSKLERKKQAEEAAERPYHEAHARLATLFHEVMADRQLLVNGFVKDVLQELPMEFAVEAQKLVAISLEGSVG